MELYHAVAAVHVQQRATANFTFEIRVAQTPSQALVLFTPEGERAWDPQWNPIYASEHVFTTDEHQVQRVWLIDAYDPRSGLIRYTVFTPGKMVTRITVQVRASGSGSVAHVTYDRTSIEAAADGEVASFARHGESMRAEWQSAIDSATTHH
jgi:hypothetical protein